MSDLEQWLDDFVGESFPPNSTSDPHVTSASAKAPKKAKKTSKGSNQPWYTKFPPIERVRAMRAQFFDNGPNPGKGNTQHTLKLRVYLDDGLPLNQREPHWHRVVELIEPKKVVAWAVAEHDGGRLAEDDLARYRAVADDLRAWKEEEPDSEWAKMGHIGSPPGNHYFHNQFVAVRCGASGEMDAVFHLEDGQIEIDRFYANKRSRKANAPKLHGLYDPYGAIVSKEDGDGEL
ncbi:hypothetical protein KEU06_28890 [Pseudaminobacter sp. 19-2017]|uniref:Uncharacterized protein n=1 Tax=Pseudaminobacter soli (ex Zhang et al. 2022) TaxID=2831468 RepID=A0A942E409_9HYPH|nr:hypothetical protein [Pseudaminobacter soli]MBS3652597.1 hypothetical protein [Pseudaminobacter soli]